MMKRKITLTLDFRLTWFAIETVAVERGPISDGCAQVRFRKKRFGGHASTMFNVCQGAPRGHLSSDLLTHSSSRTHHDNKSFIVRSCHPVVEEEIGSTVTGGIQKIAAILPISTEQCSDELTKR
jgi:hypothetical protein